MRSHSQKGFVDTNEILCWITSLNGNELWMVVNCTKILIMLYNRYTLAIDYFSAEKIRNASDPICYDEYPVHNLSTFI